ncbi:MAG: adenosylcobalamin-dependent ribonucleoside-diphosphate reductase [Nanoarchaeota archaeon]|nr:adenosylcobalamin-dependent ribonucleoside-diphosphate reductase [Nanoarchaeota archaeon]
MSEEVQVTERRQNFPEYVQNSELEKRLTPNQMYSLNKKYLKRNDTGEIIETPSEAVYRMAKTMAEVEFQYGASEEKVAELTEKFYHVIDRSQFSPAGRVWTNAGTDTEALFNCYVLPVHDSMDRDEPGSIFNSVADAAVVHKQGGGTGYNFSELRPRGAYVRKSKGVASGPVSFMGMFNEETETINSGNRRGANMGILNVTHPDILDFVNAKSRKGMIPNFNVSVGIFDKFMQAVESDDFYTLEFPMGVPLSSEILENMIQNWEENKLGGSGVKQSPEPIALQFNTEKGELVVPGKTEIIDSYSGKIAGRVDEQGHVQLSAKYVIREIAKLSHQTGDPGLIFLDTINRDNPLPNEGLIWATNPCGEQPLHINDACNLGSVILPSMIRTTSEGIREFNWGLLEQTVKTAVIFMDNVNDASKGPLPVIEETVKRHRRIGLGIMGWAEALIELEIPYGSEESITLAKEVMGFITKTAKEVSVAIANEKDVFPAFEGSVYDDGNPENRVRNCARTTIAPNGTISMVYDVTGGIEPNFAIAYRKNIRGNDTLEYVNSQFKRKAEKRGLDVGKLIGLIEENHGSVQGIPDIPEDMQAVFRTAHDLSYKEHIAVQAAFQEETDNAISKTINMKNEATVDDVEQAYLIGWRSGLKGLTVYRDGSKDIQVLETGRKEEKQGGLENVIVDLTNVERPEDIGGRTVRVQTPYNFEGKPLNAFMTLNRVLGGELDKREYELFINMGKAGGDLHANMEGYGKLISLLFKKGATAEEVLRQLDGISGETQHGIGPNAVRSLPDTIAKGIRKVLEREGHKINGNNGLSGNLCPECSGPLAEVEGCQKCLNAECGYSKC